MQNHMNLSRSFQELRSRATPSAWVLALILSATGPGTHAQVAQYSFAATQGTYTPFSDGTVLVAGSFLQEVYVVQLPTPFWFDGNY